MNEVVFDALTYMYQDICPDDLFASFSSELIDRIIRSLQDIAIHTDPFWRKNEIISTINILSFVNRYWYVTSRQFLKNNSDELMTHLTLSDIKLTSIQIAASTSGRLNLIQWAKHSGCR